MKLHHTAEGFNGAVASQPRKVCWQCHKRIHGRCFNGAVASQPRKVFSVCKNARPAKRLQWGRGFAATEGAVALVSLPRMSSFNGAVASQPRKDSCVLTSILCHNAASMGPWLRSHGRP